MNVGSVGKRLLSKVLMKTLPNFMRNGAAHNHGKNRLTQSRSEKANNDLILLVPSGVL